MTLAVALLAYNLHPSLSLSLRLLLIFNYKFIFSKLTRHRRSRYLISVIRTSYAQQVLQNTRIKKELQRNFLQTQIKRGRKKMVTATSWASMGSALASFLFTLLPFLSPYQYIKLHEYSGEHITRDELYSAAELYISSVCLHHTWGLKAEIREHMDRPLLTIDDDKEVTDIFNGTTIWWHASKERSQSNIVFTFSRNMDEQRHYNNTFSHTSYHGVLF
jgi:Domain associated at C-terminal with AAA